MASILSLLVGLFGVSMVSSQLMSMFGGGEGTQIDPLLYLTASSGPGPNDIFSIQMRIFTAQLKGKMMAKMMGKANNPQVIKMLTFHGLQQQAQSAQQQVSPPGQQMGFPQMGQQQQPGFGSMMPPSFGPMSAMPQMTPQGTGGNMMDLMMNMGAGGAPAGGMGGMAGLMNAMRGMPAA